MSIQTPEQPSGFTASFTIKVTGLRTATIGERTNVVKQIDWVMIGEKSAQTFELPQTTQLPDPNGQTFIPLSALTEAEVIQWIEANDERIPVIKAHIQYVLDKEVGTPILTTVSIPWEPVVETTPPTSAS
jgi:hypothetical protein